MFLEKIGKVNCNDILKFLFSIKKEYEPLYILGCDYLASQGTSCCAERAASQGRVILNDRDNLSEENFRQEALMKSFGFTKISLIKKEAKEPPKKKQKTRENESTTSTHFSVVESDDVDVDDVDDEEE